MSLFSIITNTTTLSFLIYHVYTFYKARKLRENRNKKRKCGLYENSNATQEDVLSVSSMYKSEMVEDMCSRRNDADYDSKMAEKLRNYPYVFILIALLQATEQCVVLIKYLPFYYVIKLLLVLMICVPGTKMANRIYREYVYRFCQFYEDEIDNFLDKFKKHLRDYSLQIYNEAFFLIKPKIIKDDEKAIKFTDIDKTSDLLYNANDEKKIE
ncbi:hypothetical protein EDEG_00322 [Edhazardia aedis USNM 41457]|uniref:Protein YOP1 n=1 Tax=Edhazardia aedis (strain USNM 41457) TaxID=1003232 RepID=J9D2A8_EDHAE|nr:hypothetical protein EDEG_00322 [Edhazardia aedis USNM 41457]|eukprot:EJW01976.1 hypothetical protein EDEG_00322 [Edhazardia aedis USNM 41457]